MADLLLVPEVAAGATEVVIGDWLVKAGDQFHTGDPIIVIETDKAVVEVEAETDATLLKTLVEVGNEVGVGRPMALIGTTDEVGADYNALLGALGVSATPSTPAPERRDVPEARTAAGHAQTSTSHTATADIQQAAPTSVASPTLSATPTSSGRRFISPIARKLLKDAGLSVDGIEGTGPSGRVVRRDVEAAVADRADTSAMSPASRVDNMPQTAPVAVGGADFADTPHSRLRKAVAARLTQSKQEIPHFYVKRSAGIDELLALRAQLNLHSPVKLSVNDFIIRAVAVAHRAVPAANVIWTDEAMRQFDSVDISVAVASERGLVTPVLRSVENLSLSSISTQVKQFVEAANAGRLRQSDLEGGSISITNLGMFGVEEFSAIINPPQSAIVAIGAGTPVVRVVDGEITAVTTINLVMSVDHRAIDGALAAEWMSALVDAIENPLRLVI